MQPSDLATLATLNALLQEGSVSAAARRLGLSTPAVSHALAKLRTRFDDPLLVRAGRRMVLTPRAQSLKPKVRDAIATASIVFAEQEVFEPKRLARVFTVSMTDYILLVFGSQIDTAISRGAPGLDLRVVPNSVEDPLRLRNGETDLAIGIYGDLPPELKTRVLITERLVCVVRNDHPTVGRRLTLEQFVQLHHIQVAPRGRPGGYLDNLLQQRGFCRRVVRAVPYFQVALEMTARTDRVLTVSERIARLLGPQLGLRVLEPPLHLEPFALSMVWHPRFDADRAHSWLRQQLLEVSQAMAAISHPQHRKRLSRSNPTVGFPSKR